MIIKTKNGTYKITKIENRWTPSEAMRYWENAKKEYEKKKDDESKRRLDEIKDIIKKECQAAFVYFDELDKKHNMNKYNALGTGNIPYYGEAKKNYTSWKLVVERIS